MSCAKNRSKKLEVFLTWDQVQNGPSCKGYSLYKILTLAQKLKFQKACQNPFYKWFRVVLCKKKHEKNTKYSRNETIFKITHHAKAIASAKSSLWLKNQNCQKHVKIHSTNRLEWFCKKIARKNAKYSRNETIFKMRHHAKAIAFYKILVMAQKLNFQKTS